jgi:CBS domain-containing protein
MATTGSETTAAALDEVTVDEAMSRRVVTGRPDWSLAAAGRKMAEEKIHCIVVAGVVRRRGREELKWGILSDEDLVRFCAGGGDWSAGEAAGAQIVAVEPADTVHEAARLMSENRTAHLVVVEPATGEPVGVISTLDVARVIGRGHD